MTSNLISLARNLQQRKGRGRRGLTLAEGVRLVEEALAAEVRFRGVLTSRSLANNERGAALLGELAAHAVPIEELSDRDLASVADTETPQGVVAVIEHPRFDLSEINPMPRHPILVLDGVQDPGNVGTMLRTAFALGSPGVLILKGTADATNPKALRSASGASFRLPAVVVTDEDLAAWLDRSGTTLWVTDATGTPLRRLEPPRNLAVVVGNEGAGVRPALVTLASNRVAIPLARGAESLNVAVAAGIILHEVQRDT